MSDSLWARCRREPVFVLTGDQDWAASWMLERQLEIAARHDAPLHLFVTNEDPLLDRPPAGLRLGIHPNFLPGSTHGADPRAAIEHCLALVPGATTARTHGFTESMLWLAELVQHGVRVDSNGCTMLQAGIEPQLHAAGLLRLPVFLEDDMLLHWAGAVPPLEALRPLLATPGLKILNFHPALVGLNVRSNDDYTPVKGDLANAAPPRHGERGIADLLDELLAHIVATGAALLAFEDAADALVADVAREHPDGILGWHPGARWRF